MKESVYLTTVVNSCEARLVDEHYGKDLALMLIDINRTYWCIMVKGVSVVLTHKYGDAWYKIEDNIGDNFHKLGGRV